MLRRILDPARRKLLDELRATLDGLRVLLVRGKAPEEDQKALARSIAQIDEPFLLVVAGEFNAGKSSVINALLGEAALEEGVTPTTSRIQLVRHGGQRRRTPAGGGFEEITLPVKILREMNVVDTPGTNAVIEGHEALARDFVPRSDLVLFVTSADRPFTASERAFLEAIRDWGKKVVVAINKADILETRQDIDKVIGFVRDSMRTQLGIEPEIFAVSARRAQKLKAAGVSPNTEDGFGALETHVTCTLDSAERVRLKLLNPAGVAARVLDTSSSALSEQLGVLDADRATLEEIGAELASHQEQLSRELRVRLSDLDKPVLELEARGEIFLERALSLRGLLDLTRAETTRQAYERQVVAGLRTSVEKRIDGVVDTLAGGDPRLESLVTDRLEARRVLHGTELGKPFPPLRKTDRAQLASLLKREVQRALAGYDARGEARRLAGTAQRTALVAAALLFAGLAVVVGGFATGGTSAIAGGFVLGGVLVAVGGAMVAMLRRREQALLRERLGPVRQRLGAAVRAVIEKEQASAAKSARATMDPFETFVRSESAKLRTRQAELARLGADLGALRRRVEGLR
jgi:small GTP-binding protein